MAFLPVTGALASMVTDAGAGPHVVHGPDDGLPEARIFSMFFSESIPWFIQCRWMTSACWNSGSEVMSVPVLAMSTAKMFFLLKRLALQIDDALPDELPHHSPVMVQ